MSRRLALLLAPLFLAGCSSWFGEAEEPPLPGVREAVLLIDEGLAPDPAIASLPIVLPAPVGNPDWPQAMGNARHQPGHVALNADIAEAWRTDVGAGDAGQRRILSQPVAGRDAIYAMDANGVVTALAARDGSRLWRTDPGGDADADRLRAGGLALGDGSLYVTTGSGEVVALDASSGAERWRRGLLAPIRTAPTVAEGRVLVTTSGSQTFALDAKTGAVLWQHAGLAEQTAILGGASPAEDAGLVVAGLSSGEVFGLDLTTGGPVWTDTVIRPRRTLAIGGISDITGDPVIAGDQVVVAGNGGEMAGMRKADGQRLWEIDLTSANTPWVAGGFAYVLTDRNELVAVILDGGRVRWVSPLQRLQDPKDSNSRRVFWTGPILAGDRLVLASSDGEAVSVSPYTGEVLGRIPLPGGVSVPPLVANGTLYFLTDGGKLVAYR